MKRLVLMFLLVVTILAASGCSYGMDEEPCADAPSMFVKVEGCGAFNIVYDRDTKVMYAVSSSSYNYGNVTILVNADGTPKVWTRR
ncbi:MAG: hypothetical protein ACLS7L_05630 [Clostridium sp.]